VGYPPTTPHYPHLHACAGRAATPRCYGYRTTQYRDYLTTARYPGGDVEPPRTTITFAFAGRRLLLVYAPSRLRAHRICILIAVLTTVPGRWLARGAWLPAPMPRVGPFVTCRYHGTLVLRLFHVGSCMRRLFPLVTGSALRRAIYKCCTFPATGAAIVVAARHWRVPLPLFVVVPLVLPRHCYFTCHRYSCYLVEAFYSS